MNISIYRNGIFIVSVEIDNSTRYTHVKMGTHKVDANFYSNEKLDIRIGDYIEFEGEKFYVNNIPQIQEISSTRFEYKAIFEGERYTLYIKKLRHLSNAQFSYHGTAQAHLKLIIDNINEINSGWSIGEVTETETKTIRYNSLYCREALNEIADAFDLEYSFKGKQITLKASVALESNYTFQYGYNKGLYSLTQRPVDSTNVITRWYGFGATKNIDAEYRNGQNRLIFEEKFIDVDVDLYGIREGDYIDEDVFPQRTGYITGIDDDEVNRIIDDSLEFDINDYLISGVTAKIVFKTGALAGSEFEINNYNHSTKEIVFNSEIDQYDYETPNDVRKPTIGDAYTLIGINMPESYLQAAEALLKQKTEAYANDNRLAVIYDLEVDPRYLKRKQIELLVGTLVQVQSDNLGINEQIEINQISKPLANPYEVRLVLSNTTVIAEADKNLQIIKQAPKRLQESERKSIDRDRQEILRKKRHSVSKVFRGEFDSEEKYINTNNRSDVVKYQDLYWFYQGQNDVAAPWNSKNWYPFEGNFESVATNTLFAENASIADWTIKDGKITSQTEQNGIPNMILSGVEGVIKMSGLDLTGFRQKSELRDEGSFLESAGMPLEEYTALLGQRLITSNSSIIRNSIEDVSGEIPNRFQNIIAAYYGKAINTNSNDPSPAYGGYFDNLRADGLSLGTKVTDAINIEIGGGKKVESFYILFGAVSTTVTFLPTTGLLEWGKIVVILNYSEPQVIISGTILNSSSSIILERLESAIFIFYGGTWFRIGGYTETEINNIASTVANKVYTDRSGNHF